MTGYVEVASLSLSQPEDFCLFLESGKNRGMAIFSMQDPKPGKQHWFLSFGPFFGGNRE